METKYYIPLPLPLPPRMGIPRAPPRPEGDVTDVGQ